MYNNKKTWRMMRKAFIQIQEAKIYQISSNKIIKNTIKSYSTKIEKSIKNFMKEEFHGEDEEGDT